LKIPIGIHLKFIKAKKKEFEIDIFFGMLLIGIHF
jgi:hypothetical protein